MGKTCWKCNQKIGFREKYNHFLKRSNVEKIQLHNDCYLSLTKDEMKKISYNIKVGAPKGLRKNLNLEKFLIGGFVGSDGFFIGQMAGTKRTIKKKGLTFEELDDMCINKYGYHYPILPEKLQLKIIEEIKR